MTVLESITKEAKKINYKLTSAILFSDSFLVFKVSKTERQQNSLVKTIIYLGFKEYSDYTTLINLVKENFSVEVVPDVDFFSKDGYKVEKLKWYELKNFIDYE